MTLGRLPVIALVVSAGLAGCRNETSADSSGVKAAATAAGASTDPAAEQTAANDAYAREEYDSAEVMFKRIAARAEQAHDTLLLARALTQSGLAAWHAGHYADARALGERALALKIAARLEKEVPKSYNALGLLSHNEGRFSQALDAFNRSEEAALIVGDSLAAVKARGNRGLVYSDIGDFARARAAFSSQRDRARALGDTQVHNNALVNLGMVEIRAGAPGVALPVLTEALRLQRAAGSVAGEENALGQLGTAYQAMGEPQLAIAYLDSALSIAQANAMRQQESDDLQLLAQCYGELGEHTRALQFLTRADSLAGSMGMLNIQGDIARAQARSLLAIGDVRGARQRADAARQFHADAGSTLEQLMDELAIAELGRREGDSGGLRAERSAIESARRLAAANDSHVARIELALGEARVAEAGRDPRGVLAAVARARKSLGAATTGREWEASALEARAYLQLGQLESSVRAGREAVRRVEQVRGRLGSGPLRASLTTERSAVYANLVVALLGRGETAEAFAVADAARSRALMEHLSVARRNTSIRTPASDLVASEQLLRRIDKLVELLRVADTASPRRRNVADDERGFLTDQLEESRHDYETFLLRSANSKARSVAIARAELPDPARVRSALNGDEAMIEYFATETRLITFVVSARGVRALEVPITDQALASRVRLARDLMSRRESTNEARRPVMTGLHELLIGPAQNAGLLEGIRTLVIVPHDALAYFPFAALVDPKTGRYLIATFDTFELPSASSLVAVRNNPVSVGTRGETIIFAPFTTALPGTRVEANAIANSTRLGRQYFDADATESTLRSSLGTEKIVHVATHGVLNPSSPMFSGIELNRPSSATSTSANDGRLEVHEVLELSIRSPLVFLSGCETGSGAAWSTSFRRGDDYATLAQAFLFAGARNVISTLWRIEDQGAAAFASRFYASLGRKDPISTLAAAQRAMLTTSYSHPYYWAAFVASGDGRSIGP